MGPDAARPLFLTTAGQWRLRRALAAGGYAPRLGWPGAGAMVATWGQGRHAWRARALARWTQAPILHIEDAPLRGLFPGRLGEPPLGLILDDMGLHSDASRPSRVEHILSQAPLDDPELLRRARDACAWMQDAHLTKYAAVDPDLPVPAPGYVLVVDQVRGDAAAPDARVFRQMLEAARRDHPGARIVIKTHPETRNGLRPGHFSAADGTLLDAGVSPWPLLARAQAVYTVSSQLGLEAVLAGHRPHVFGTPIYAGWGLTQDRVPLPRRTRRLSVLQLFAGLYILAPTWIDPRDHGPATLEETLARLEARARAWRADRQGWTISGASRWKHRWMRRHFGAHGPVRFGAAAAPGQPHMAWGTRAKAPTRVEDGFLRSRGLGAQLIPAQSLCVDALGLHYDPEQPSELERLIAASPSLPPRALARAHRLRQRLVERGHGKYGLSGTRPSLPDGPRVLVVGQVADDASVRLGAPGLTDAHLLSAARDAQPNACLIYKPHPDVVAGLRRGSHLPDGADLTVPDADLGWLLGNVDAVWTLTSLAGFEALLRGTPVTCLGRPFYAGWGLSRDLGPPLPRRTGAVTLDGLLHAALIDYPRYWDPVTGAPCPVEDLLDVWERGPKAPSAMQRIMTALQTAWHRRPPSPQQK